MKKLYALFLLFALLNHANISFASNIISARENHQLSQSPDDVLKNQDILDMLKAGVSPEIIIAKIKSSECGFDTSPKILQEMKTAGVPEAVILAMVEASASKAKVQSVIAIPDNTLVELELAFDINSASSKQGDSISFRVIKPLMINGITVIEKDALANGKIITAKKARRWGREGKLAWSVEDVTAIDGKAVRLKATSSMKGESNKGEVAVKTAVTTALLIGVPVLAPLALLNGFKRGHNIVVPAGTRFTVFINGNTSVTVTKGGK